MQTQKYVNLENKLAPIKKKKTNMFVCNPRGERITRQTLYTLSHNTILNRSGVKANIDNQHDI